MNPKSNNDMSTRKQLWKITGSLCFIMLVAGCGESIKERRENLELLKMKATALDSLIEMEAKKLHDLDSLLRDEEIRVFHLDSVLKRESRRIDTLVQNLYKKIDESKSIKK